MRIKFDRLEAIEGTNAKGVWTGVQVHGTNIDNGAPYDKLKLFNNNTEHADFIAEFNNFEQGTKLEIKFDTSGRFPKLQSIRELSDDEAAPNPTQYRPTGSPAQVGGTKGGNGDKMSKEEWAAKDAATKRSIALAVALKEANNCIAVGSTPEELITIAEALVPFLLDETADPLDPPKED